MTMPGGDLDTVVQRLADDEAFAQSVRDDATKALYGYLLTNWDRDRIIKIANGIDPDAPELDENGQPIVPVEPPKGSSRKRGKKAAAVAPAAVAASTAASAGTSTAASTAASAGTSTAASTAASGPGSAPGSAPASTPAGTPRLVATPLSAQPPRQAPPPPPAPPAPPVEESPRRRGLLLALLGGAAVLVLAALFLGGVFGGSSHKGTSSLRSDPTPFISDTPTPTPTPTEEPSSEPTAYPVDTPTVEPTFAPTLSPTVAPTTAAPTFAPTEEPTQEPTEAPTHSPSPKPKPTKAAPALPDPVVGDPSASNGNIFEETCGSPTTSVISARVTDKAGIKSVQLTWFVNGVNRSGGPKTMSGSGSGSIYKGTLGSFAQSTLGADTQPIDVTVTATDSGGRQSSTTTQVTLTGC